MSVCMPIYFRVGHFGCIVFLFRELLLNACVDNQKRGFWGPYLWHLDLHNYSFLISYKIFAARSRSERVPPSNLRQQRPLHHLWIRHKLFYALIVFGGWRRRSETCEQTRPSTRDGRREWESERVGRGTRPPMKPKPDFVDDHQSRRDNNPLPLLLILRRSQCLPLLPLQRLTMSLLPPPLPLLAPSLPPQPYQKPQL